jgi:hypothetical protein
MLNKYDSKIRVWVAPIVYWLRTRCQSVCFNLNLFVTHWQWPLALSGIENVHIIVKLWPLLRTLGYILQIQLLLMFFKHLCWTYSASITSTLHCDQWIIQTEEIIGNGIYYAGILEALIPLANGLQ